MSDYIQKIVNDNLNEAMDNAYHELLELSVDEIVDDMKAWAPDCEDLDEDAMRPCVEAWLKNRKLQ